MTRSTKAELVEADAQNRAVRTFLTGLAIDIAVAIAISLAAVFATAGGWGDLQWALISFSFAKSIGQAVASYILRRFLDKTNVVPEAITPPAETGE